MGAEKIYNGVGLVSVHTLALFWASPDRSF